jgi:hypothetical protein
MHMNIAISTEHHIESNGGYPMNWKGWGRKHLLPNQDTITAIAWRGWGKPRTEVLLVYGSDLNQASPRHRPRSTTSEPPVYGYNVMLGWHTNSTHQSTTWRAWVIQLPTKIPTIYMTCKFITIFTMVCHLSLSWPPWIQFTNTLHC